MRKFLYILTLTLMPVLAHAQNFPFQSTCTVGNTKANVSGIQSVNTLQGSYPQCTVSVFLTGTTTLATIFSNSSGTSLSNPFTASIDGSYIFYTAAGSYDVTMSGGLNGGFPVPKTLTDVTVSGPSSGGGVNPSSIPQPIAFYRVPGSLVSPTVSGSSVNNMTWTPGLLQLNTSAFTRKQPIIDPANPDFGTPSGCANPADPTGTNDSSCAIQAAVAYSMTNPLSSTPAAYMQVRLGAGKFLIHTAIRAPCSIEFSGSGRNASQLASDGNHALLVMFNSGATQAPDGFTCGGHIHDIGFTNATQAIADINHSALVELDSAPGLHFNDVSIWNHMGIGILLNGSTERSYFDNTFISDVGRPVRAVSGSTNENANFGINIASPGMTLDGTCDGVNCGISGQWPTNTLLASQVVGGVLAPNLFQLISATGNGSGGATFVVQCNNISGAPRNACPVATTTPTTTCTSGLTGNAPLCAGNYFQITGIPDVTAFNGVWQATTVTGNTPTGQFTITTTLVTGDPTYGPDQLLTYLNPTTATPSGSTASPGSGNFTIYLWPTFQKAVTLNNASVNEWDRSSMKSLQYIGGMQVTNPGGSASHFYGEGFPANGQPRPNTNIDLGGYLPYTKSTAAFSGNTTTCTTTAPCTLPVIRAWDMLWFASDATHTSDLVSGSGFLAVMPCDYNPSINTASTCVSGVNRNQMMIMQEAAASDGAMHVLARDVFVSLAAGVLAPTGITWPAGSLIGFPQNMANLSPFNTGSLFHMQTMHMTGDGGLAASYTDFNGGPGNTTPFLLGNSPFTNALMSIGPIPDNVVNFNVATPGETTFSTQMLVDDGLNYPCLPATNAYRNCLIAWGRTRVIARGGGAITSTGGSGADNLLTGTVVGPSTENVVAVKHTSPDFAIGQSIISYQDADNDIFLSMPTVGSAAGSHYEGYNFSGNDTANIYGATPGTPQGSFAHVFTDSISWLDTPAVSGGGTGNHALNRFLFKGSPTQTGTNAGFEYDTWSGASLTCCWVNAMSFGPGGIGGTIGTDIPLLDHTQNFLLPNSFSGAFIGRFDNTVTYSWQIGHTPDWSFASSSGSSSFAMNAALDPFGIATDATEIISTEVSAGLASFSNFNVGPNPIAGATYTVTFYAQAHAGDPGGQTMRVGISGGIQTVAGVAPTSWKQFCAVVVAGTGVPTQQLIIGMQGSGNVDFWGAAVGMGATCQPPWHTVAFNASQVANLPSVQAVNFYGSMVDPTKNKGRAVLASGTVTVSDTTITATPIVNLTNCGPAGTGIGIPSLGTVTAGTGFVINSISATNTTVTTDTSTICWSH